MLQAIPKLIASLDARTVPPVAISDLWTTLSTKGNPIFFTPSLLRVLFLISKIYSLECAQFKN